MEKIEVSSGENRDKNSKFLIRFLERIKIDEIIESPEKKLEFIHNLEFEDFKKMLIRINGILRSTPNKDRAIDGYNVVLSSPSPDDSKNKSAVNYIPPYHWNKEKLLENCLNELKKLDNLDDIALLLSLSINAIHPFKDGNGRTSRLAYIIFKENFQDLEKNQSILLEILSDKGRSRGVDISTEKIEKDLIDVIKKELNINLEDKTIPDQLSNHLTREEESLEFLHENLLKNPSGVSVEKINNRINFLDILINDDSGFWGSTAIYQYLKDSDKLKDEYIQIIREQSLDRKVLGNPKYAVIKISEVKKNLNNEDVLGILRKHEILKNLFIEKAFDIIINPDKYPLKDDPSKTIKSKLEGDQK